jgi:cyclopropane fatty-acyl-phospholipid synthase-like methyltransferase
MKNSDRRQNMKKKLNLMWILFLILTTVLPRAQEQKRRMPDYNERNSWQQPEKILDVIGIKLGMIIADVGAGRGYFTFRLAKRVGPQGKVYATEIDAERLNVIKERAQEENIQNIVTVLGEVVDPRLPKGEMDVILMVHVFQIIYKYQYPTHLQFIKNVLSCLKPDGCIVMVEWDFSKLGLEKDSRQYTEEQFKVTMEDAGLEIVRTETFLEYDDIHILRLK